MPEKEQERLRAAKAAGLKTILFVCSGNAIRSQIAEGIVNHMFGRKWAAFSAGTMPMKVPKDLVKVMREIGVDISSQRSKHIDIFKSLNFDKVVVLCSDVERMCPVLPDCTTQDHIFFHDPLSSAAASEGILFGFASTYRQLRDEMKKVIAEYMKDS
ncbi:MAG TPA: arsenate reductase ArsC [Dissulfurispiraceae bacterium]|nr:arsenate reductase ArsC [Dissulfurispiraceae bacterium]